MNGVLAHVRERIEESCIHDGTLKKNGCKVIREGIPEPDIVIDFDKEGAPVDSTGDPGQARRCDYPIIAEEEGGDNWVVLLESKRGDPSGTDEGKQLQAGALAALKKF